MTLTDFLLARIAEDEAWARRELCSECWPDGPARVLAECEAKRRTLSRHAEVKIQSYEDRPGCCDHCDGAPDWPCADVNDLATIYSNHPDFRDGWRQ